MNMAMIGLHIFHLRTATPKAMDNLQPSHYMVPAESRSGCQAPELRFMAALSLLFTGNALLLLSAPMPPTQAA